MVHRALILYTVQALAASMHGGLSASLGGRMWDPHMRPCDSCLAWAACMKHKQRPRASLVAHTCSSFNVCCAAAVLCRLHASHASQVQAYTLVTC
jgi:hypothetical protein